MVGRLSAVGALDAEGVCDDARDADPLPETRALRDSEGDVDALRDTRALPLGAPREGEADPLSVPPCGSLRPSDPLGDRVASERSGVRERVPTCDAL